MQIIIEYEKTLKLSRASCEEERVALLEAGASVVCCDERESSLRLAGSLLATLGMERGAVSKLCREDREQSETKDIRNMEEHLREKVSNDQKSFIFSSGTRRNLADHRYNMAESLKALAKEQLPGWMWPAQDADDDEEVGEPIYSISEKTRLYRDPVVAAAEKFQKVVERREGVDGVDFCRIPESEDAVLDEEEGFPPQVVSRKVK